MINQEFESRLTSFKNIVTSEGDVVSTFTIVHEAEGEGQDFLDELDNVFNTNISKCLDYPSWKSVTYPVTGTHVELNFDSVSMPVELVNIKVNQKDKKLEKIFVYSLTFQKVLNANVDPVFATSYLKRKEENEDGKMVICLYPTTLVKKG